LRLIRTVLPGFGRFLGIFAKHARSDRLDAVTGKLRLVQTPSDCVHLGWKMQLLRWLDRENMDGGTPLTPARSLARSIIGNYRTSARVYGWHGAFWMVFSSNISGLMIS